MIGPFIEKTMGLLNRQFILAFWFPVFIASCIVIFLNGFFFGNSPMIILWKQVECFLINSESCKIDTQLDLIIEGIFIITILA